MRVLVVDDEENLRHMLSLVLKKEGYEVSLSKDGASALSALEKDDFDFILCDIKMPGMDGVLFLKEFKKTDAGGTVIMMSAYGTVDTALECMRLGAYDYISKPFKTDEVLLTIKKAEEREKLKKEKEYLKKEAEKDRGEFYTKDERMLEALDIVRKVSDYDSTVLITGETGTGKELIARAIHSEGKRKNGAFVAINCGAIPEKLLESELFGHLRGAFTDAVKTRDGLFVYADGGTIFLDEIGELPKELQVKLLRVLEEREVRRIGDTKTIKVDVRVVAATARNLEGEIRNHGFREDLYYRLNVIPIKLPPLRERKGDIKGLTKIFIERYSKKYSKYIRGVEDDVMGLLIGYAWPGNVRELENIIERAVILVDGETIGAKEIPLPKESAGALPLDVLSIKKAEVSLEKELIKKALEITNGNKTKAAELLEISHRALLYKVKNYGL